jgi:hypothetical protein
VSKTSPKPHVSEVKHIFLDTEVFDANQFDLGSANFSKLVSLVEEGSTNVFITDVTRREVLAHIDEKAREANTRLKQFRAAASILRLSSAAPFQGLFARIKAEQLQEVFRAEFESFCTRCKIEVISTGTVEVNDVLDRYFEHRPPFGSGKKKAEFPDAIAAAALKQWCKTVSYHPLHVVSADDDWRLICEETKGFTYLPRLVEVLAIFPAPELARALREGLEQHLPRLRDMVRQKFEDLPFVIYEIDGQAEHVTVHEIDLRKLFVVHAANGDARIDIDCFIHFDVSVSIKIPESQMWNNDGTRRLSFTDTAVGIIETGISLMAEVQVDYDPENPKDVHILDVSFSTAQIELSGSQMIDES